MAKGDSLVKVFGCFGNLDRALFVDLIITLKRIEEDDSFNDKARARARGYCEALLKHEMILVGQIFLRIFVETTPLSKYLQATGIDLIAALCLVGSREELD